MRVFEKLNSKNIDEFAEWLHKYGMQDYSPWDNWFYKNYCNKCEPIIVSKEGADYHYDVEYAWCEVNEGKCKFFQDMKEPPWGKHLVKLWLESEDNYGV